MDEQQIADKLKQSVPVHEESVATPKEPQVTTDEQSSIVHDSLNELHMLKLGNLLGTDDQDKLKFIYEQALKMGKSDYESIIEQVNHWLLIQGWKFEPDKSHKLWLWLKLNQEKHAIENEIEKL